MPAEHQPNISLVSYLLVHRVVAEYKYILRNPSVIYDMTSRNCSKVSCTEIIRINVKSHHGGKKKKKTHTPQQHH